MGVLLWILVGLIAGWLTGKIMKGSGYGFFVDILLGIAGALVGGFIARHLGLDAHGGFIYSTLIALGGAIILVAIIRLLKRVMTAAHPFRGEIAEGAGPRGDLTRTRRLTMIARQAACWRRRRRRLRAPARQSAERRSCPPHRRPHSTGRCTSPA